MTEGWAENRNGIPTPPFPHQGALLAPHVLHLVLPIPTSIIKVLSS